ncbi:MAG: nicotinate-nucleotide adenylyltransferase [Cellvibrionaceae bacterium]
MANYKTIGLFGGTFDPIHFGHLRMALEFKQQLGLDEMRLVPCHKPPHRQLPMANAKHRASMVEEALKNCPDLTIDLCELENPEPSYSVHTLQHLRKALGENVSLCLAMGMDSLVGLQSWYQWEEILKLAHIIVASRPSYDAPLSGNLSEYIDQHKADKEVLSKKTHGSIIIRQLSLLPISSTDIRAGFTKNESPQFLLPDSVLSYIHANQLYQGS